MKFGETSDERAAMTGRCAVRHLVHYSPMPALALQNELRASPARAPFASQAVFDRIAAAGDLFVEVVIRPTEGGYEHVMFFAKVQGLSDAELMACRLPSTFNRHDPQGPREPI